MMVDGQLLDQPALAQEVIRAQQEGLIHGATGASLPPAQPAEGAVTAAQFVAAATPPRQAAEFAAAAAIVDLYAWLRKNYRVTHPHSHTQLHTWKNAHYRILQSPQTKSLHSFITDGRICPCLYLMD